MPFDMTPTYAIETIDQKAFLSPINQVREANGLWPVKWRPDLVCVAQAQADILKPPVTPVAACNHGNFSWRVSQCQAQAYGEVLTCNFPDLESAVRGLFTSPSHVKIIMTPEYTRAGVGFAKNGPYTTIVFTFGY